MIASQIIHNGRGSNYGHKLEDVVQRELTDSDKGQTYTTILQRWTLFQRTVAALS